MIRGTTPTHTITLSVPLDDLKDFVVTYAQNKKVVLEKTKADYTVEEDKLVITLTQEETLKFNHDDLVEVQAKVLTMSGAVFASQIESVFVGRILNEGVLV